MREKKKTIKKDTNRKKTRPSKTWSISILTYDTTISDENSQNVVSTSIGRDRRAHVGQPRTRSKIPLSFSIQNKKLTVFSLSCYILVDVMKGNNYC